ncbi:hypothetical protein D3C77_591470 [compost metagenome]
MLSGKPCQNFSAAVLIALFELDGINPCFAYQVQQSKHLGVGVSFTRRDRFEHRLQVTQLVQGYGQLVARFGHGHSSILRVEIQSAIGLVWPVERHPARLG